MDSAAHLARVLPEMARAARNSVLTVDALYTLLAGLRSTLHSEEFAQQLRVALQHLEAVRRGLPTDQAQAAFAIVEDACSRLAVLLQAVVDGETSPKDKSAAGSDARRSKLPTRLP